MSEDVLPEGWATTALANACVAIQYGYTASASERPRGPRFLRITDIQDGVVDWSAVPSCDIDEGSLRKFRLAWGDIVFARSGATTGKSFLVRDCPKDAVFASYLIRVRPVEGIDPRFLSYYFQTPAYWSYISENLAGNAQPNCNASKLSALPLLVPPVAEQRRIVEKAEALLARVNAARDRLAKVPAILKRFRQSVLGAACSGRLTEDWRETRAPEWKHLELQDVAQVIDPNPSHRYPSYENGTVPILATEQFDGLDGWNVSTAKLANAAFHAERVAAHGFLSHDIVFARKGRLGLARRPPQVERFVFSHTIFIVRATNPADSPYLLWFLRQDECVDWLRREMNSNTGVPTLGKAYMERLPVRMPPRREQQEIVRRVEELFALAAAIERRIAAATARADRLTQSILAKAFRGDLVPIEAELARQEGRGYEPASVLLERVRAEADTAGGPGTVRRDRSKHRKVARAAGSEGRGA